MPIELISFGMGAKWISQLWGRLRGIRKSYTRELEEINTIIFGDPLEIAEYYIEPDCQERNPTDQDVEPHLIVSVPRLLRALRGYHIRRCPVLKHRKITLK